MKKSLLFIGNNATFMDSMAIRLLSVFDIQLCLAEEHKREDDDIGVRFWEPSSYLSAKTVVGSYMRKQHPEQVVLLFSPHKEDFTDFSVKSIEEACDSWIKGWLFILKELEPFLYKDAIMLTFVLDTRKREDSIINFFLEKSFFYLADRYLEKQNDGFSVRAVIYSSDLESELCDFISDLQVPRKSKKWQYIPKKRGFLGI
ncbi:hypothetical protein WKV44_01505 [Spirochaetia bacterium 38H-sp]|uniref:Uncharacterized protein n=1 Tax=Rarispira pelagica TaxID=3141764 RepID=A0ABU9U969_9SPIR